MKTSIFDVALVSICVLLIAALSGLTAWALPTDGSYGPLIDLGVFLLAYGLYTMLWLAALRSVWPYPKGNFSMDSSAFTYWKINAVLVDLACKALAPFNTVFTQALLHAGLGAKIGPQAAIAGILRDHPLLEIGSRATIGQNSVITAHAITHNEILLKTVRIGAGAVVGVGCVVLPGVELGEGAVLAPGAVATVDTKIPANELWGGIPARKLKDLGHPE